MYTYKIKTENKNDTLQTIITKEGITADFTLGQVYDHKLKLEQEIKEKEGQIEIHQATMDNILSNHKDVAKIVKKIKESKNSQGILATLFLYIQNDIDRDNNERMVKERKSVIREYRKELKTIHEALSIPEPVKISYEKGNK